LRTRPKREKTFILARRADAGRKEGLSACGGEIKEKNKILMRKKIHQERLIRSRAREKKEGTENEKKKFGSRNFFKKIAAISYEKTIVPALQERKHASKIRGKDLLRRGESIDRLEKGVSHNPHSAERKATGAGGEKKRTLRSS